MATKEPREIAEIVENAMHEFNLAMQHRREFSNITRRRLSQVIWISAFSVIMLAGAMFYLIYTLTRDTHNITLHVIQIATHMRDINSSFHIVSEDLQNIRTSVGNMDRHIGVIPVMSEAVGNINTNILEMKNNVKLVGDNTNTMSEDLSHLNRQLTYLNGQLFNINNQFNGLNNHVNMMGYDMNRAVAPMKFFPFAPQ